MTLPDFQFIIMITVTIRIAVLNQFSWNSHGWCESTHGWTLIYYYNFFLETRENVPPKRVFGFHSASMVVFEKKISTPYSVPHFPRKGCIHFCRETPHSLKNGHTAPKKFLAVILENIFFFFWKKLLYKKYSKLHFLQKNPYHSKWLCPPTNGFS